MKLCPFCSEEIQDKAIKCKHCKEWLVDSKKENDNQQLLRQDSGERRSCLNDNCIGILDENDSCCVCGLYCGPPKKSRFQGGDTGRRLCCDDNCIGILDENNICCECGRLCSPDGAKSIFESGGKATVQKGMANCKACGKEVSENSPICPSCGVEIPGLNVLCPDCGSTDISLGQKGFQGGSAAVGALIFGPIGLLAGGCGSQTASFICKKCGRKWSL